MQGIKAPMNYSSLDKKKKDKKKPHRDQIQNIAQNMAENRVNWGVRNEHKGFMEEVANT